MAHARWNSQLTSLALIGIDASVVAGLSAGIMHPLAVRSLDVCLSVCLSVFVSVCLFVDFNLPTHHTDASCFGTLLLVPSRRSDSKSTSTYLLTMRVRAVSGPRCWSCLGRLTRSVFDLVPTRADTFRVCVFVCFGYVLACAYVIVWSYKRKCISYLHQTRFFQNLDSHLIAFRADAPRDELSRCNSRSVGLGMERRLPCSVADALSTSLSRHEVPAVRQLQAGRRRAQDLHRVSGAVSGAAALRKLIQVGFRLRNFRLRNSTSGAVIPKANSGDP